MKSIFEFIKRTWWLFILLFCAPIIVILVFAIAEFLMHRINLTAGEWATLLGSAFSYWGTVILGTLAFWQNDQIQENNNTLMDYERNKLAPVFFVKLNGYVGLLENLKFLIANCSDNIACNLCVSDLEIFKIDKSGADFPIGKCSSLASETNNILGAHSDIEIAYKNNPINIKGNEKIAVQITISASDILGITRMTVVKIYINDKLECRYDYSCSVSN